MLEQLSIKNFALIEQAQIKFTSGLNVLSGETGAGKSILIDALSLVLGRKGRPEEIREGTEFAEVTAFLQVREHKEINSWFEDHDIYPEDGELIIRRIIRKKGKGQASIQSVPVTLSLLGELGRLLVDIHGQHEHQSLFRTDAHRKLLDNYAGIEPQVEQFSQLFSELSALTRKIEELERTEEQQEREKDFLNFSVNEIEALSLADNEDVVLESRYKILARAEEYKQALDLVLFSTSEEGALSQLRTCSDSLKKTMDIDSSMAELSQRFHGAFIELEELFHEIRIKRDQIDSDSSELVQINERMALISALEKKYRVQGASGLRDHARKSRTRLESSEQRLSKKEELVSIREQKQVLLRKHAHEISQKRNRVLGDMSQKIGNSLSQLGMNEARFHVHSQGRKNTAGKSVMGPYGMDEVEFLLSANRGEKPKSLKHVASGGELSRIMLALKSVLVESDSVQTLVFDEVDAGIGGQVAQAVGEHLSLLSKSHQVFCVTHLASIAVFADNHLQVGKRVNQDRTITEVNRVYGNDRIREIARMLDGNQESTTSLVHAKRLLEQKQGQ